MPLQVVFNDNSYVDDRNIVSWLWNFGDGFTGVLPNTTHQYLYQGIFDIQLTVISNHGCASTLTIPNFIQSFARPLAYFSYSPSTPFVSENITFIDHSFGATSWYWNFGDGNTSEERNPIHYFNTSGQYLITQIVFNNHLCSDTARVILEVQQDQQIWIPNVITPDGDGFNDIFHIFGFGWDTETFELRIFNRWGEQIFHTNNINNGWNGINQKTGHLVPQGVYIWNVKVKDLNENYLNLRGFVTVLY